MSIFMKMLNNISRSQAIYRHGRITAQDLQSSHYAYCLAIWRLPGRSQEELARELCVNKSTVARNLNYLEDKGYISRQPLPNDKRQLSVYPTEKLLAVQPQIRGASDEWMSLLSEGIPPEELEVFDRVLQQMEARAREITQRQEENK